MTRAVFKKHGKDYVSFTVTGHTGHSQSGTDIICSAVSAMTELVINTISDKYGAGIDVRIDPKEAAVSAVIYRIADEKAAYAVRGLIEGLHDQLAALADEYPEHVSVSTDAE